MLAAFAVAFSACGEKQEPDLSQVPPPPQPHAPNPPQGIPQPVLGRWTGTLTQKGVKPFPIQVTIRSATDPKRNPVHYGGQINCSGNWTYTGVKGATVDFRERINSGVGGSCKGSGQVEVTPQGAKLRYSFSGGGIQSGGVLSRP